MNDFEFSISIFAYREKLEVIKKSINCCIEASKKLYKSDRFNVCINVLINGNSQLFDELRLEFLSSLETDESFRINVFCFLIGDKANTWNQYFHQISTSAKFHVFIDGYVFIKPDTFLDILDEYQRQAFEVASGVPSQGYSAEALKKQMIKDSGIHGNLCIFTDLVLFKIRQNAFKIPIGLYRTDPLIGAAVKFGFSPKTNQWNNGAIRVLEGLTWNISPKNYLSLEFISSHFKRKTRQIQGDFENKAIRELLAIQRIDMSELPDSVDKLLCEYFDKSQISFKESILSPFRTYVRKNLQSKGIKNQNFERNLLEQYEVVRK